MFEANASILFNFHKRKLAMALELVDNGYIIKLMLVKHIVVYYLCGKADFALIPPKHIMLMRQSLLGQQGSDGDYGVCPEAPSSPASLLALYHTSKIKQSVIIVANHN